MADISNISATRNELLARKERLTLTKAGYDLLDKKRLALMQEILRLQDEVVELATQLQDLSAVSRKSLARAEALVGEYGLRSAAMGKKHNLELDLIDSQIMGVHVPRIKVIEAQREFYDRDICIIGTSPVVDEAAESYEKNIEGILSLADGEIRLAKLMKEILKTTRRLKALEHIIIPNLLEEYKFIGTALEERERSEHFSLKLAKKLIEQKYAQKKERRQQLASDRSN
jgi:V/A-type H+/Na+-transporting ATPase subunit D